MPGLGWCICCSHALTRRSSGSKRRAALCQEARCAAARSPPPMRSRAKVNAPRPSSPKPDGWLRTAVIRASPASRPPERSVGPDIGGLEQGAYLRHPPISGPTDRSGGLEAGDARITAVRSQPSGFGELGRGAFTFALERIGGGDLAAAQRASWHSAARLFEPDDRLLNA